MSLKVTAWVYDQTVGDWGAKAVLAKIADNANDAGVAWPSIALISRQTEIPERTVKRKIKYLIDHGWLTVEKTRSKSGSWGANTYTVHGPWALPPGATVAHGTGGHGDTHRGPPEVRTVGHRDTQNRQGTVSEPAGASARARTREAAPSTNRAERDALWDALAARFGEPATATEKSNRGRQIRELLAAGFTPDEVATASARWSRLYPQATLTANALVSHLGQLRGPRRPGQTPRPPCLECGVGAGLHAADCPTVAASAALTPVTSV